MQPPAEKPGFLESWNTALNVPEGEQWRDMTNGDLFIEKAIRITMVVLAALIVLGIAVAIYYCCNTTRMEATGWHWGDHGNRVWDYTEVGNAGLSAIPGVFGGVGVLALLIGSRFIDLERRGRPFQSRETIAQQEEKELNLLDKDLDFVYKNYGSGSNRWRDQNLASLTEGILTNDQKSRLFELDRKYHEDQQTIAEYANTPNARKQAETDSSSRYSRAQTSITALNAIWSKLKTEIRSNGPKTKNANQIKIRIYDFRPTIKIEEGNPFLYSLSFSRVPKGRNIIAQVRGELCELKALGKSRKNYEDL